jgi:hypothetical protein
MTILASVNNKTMMPGITPIADVPDRPTIGTATAAGLAASITFTAATTGGTPTTFTATSNPGSLTGTASSSPVTVSGLTEGTSYTFTVTAGNSTGTSPASSASNSITPVSPLSGGYDSLATTVLSSATSTITFAGIPTGYKHLQLRVTARSDHPTYAGVDGVIRFNDDSSSNYSWHYLLGYGTAVQASNSTGTTSIVPGIMASASGSGANIQAASIIDILDYANVNKFKTTRSLVALEANQTSGRDLRISSGSWRNTNAINSITITTSPSQNFLQHSKFALYGVK